MLGSRGEVMASLNGVLWCSYFPIGSMFLVFFPILALDFSTLVKTFTTCLGGRGLACGEGGYICGVPKILYALLLIFLKALHFFLK